MCNLILTHDHPYPLSDYNSIVDMNLKVNLVLCVTFNSYNSLELDRI